MIRKYCLGLVGCLWVGGLVVYLAVRQNSEQSLDRPSRESNDEDGSSPGLSSELVGGSYPWEGRVFVRGQGGKYGAMCSSYVTTQDLTVVCRSIFPNEQVKGYSSPVSAFGGSLENNVMANAPRCFGTESDILQCPGGMINWVDKSVCVRGQAAVNCQANTPMRLAGGTSLYAGRLEVFANSTWGSVCNVGFTSLDARVVCDKLGFWHASPSVVSTSSYGTFTGPVHMENVTCKGTEPDLAFCSFDDDTTCNHTTDVGINCQPALLSASYVRLTDGVQPWEGRVEVYSTFRQSWTPACSNSWTTTNSKVTCTNLGYKYGGAVKTPMPEGSSRVLLNRLTCHGNETNLAQCPGYWMRHSYDCGVFPPTTAAVDCSGGIKVQLTGGTKPQEGLVEILQSGSWAAVANSSVQTEEASALCASVGYQNTKPQVLPGNTFGRGTNQTISTLSCSGARQHISQCTISAPVVNTKSVHAAIRCFSCGDTYTSESGSIPSPGYPGSASDNNDCLYRISPKGPAQRYKLWFTNFKLSANDLVEIKEDPLSSPVGVYKGGAVPGVHLFNKDIYIRFKSQCCGARTFYIRWEAVTLESTVSLTCSDAAMNIKVNITELRWLYPDTNPAYISLVNEGCTGSYSGDTWSINNPHSQCYTNRAIDPTYVTYRNALIYKEIGSGPIVREHRWRVDMECAFIRERKISQQYSVNNEFNYLRNLSADYSAEIHLYNDSTLSNEMSYDPIRAKLGDDLYVKVNLKGNWNVSMRLQNCVGKPDPNSTITYALVRNGCSSDKETHVVYENPTTTLFHFKAFEFYAGYSTVYLSCDVKFCTPGDVTSACNWKCNTLVAKRHISNIVGTDYTVTKRLQIV
ncbi:deleted in malignant brain tumors 1 protein-like [Haliotis asinina]|uniref:deleted in malignant brain tumors 1 protein-like n=1 Tax=Haliotis asinina TaxID=109174 RepID=UPI003531E1A0